MGNTLPNCATSNNAAVAERMFWPLGAEVILRRGRVQKMLRQPLASNVKDLFGKLPKGTDWQPILPRRDTIDGFHRLDKRWCVDRRVCYGERDFIQRFLAAIARSIGS